MTDGAAHMKLPTKERMLFEVMLDSHDWNAKLSGDQDRISIAEANMAEIRKVGETISPQTAQVILNRHMPDRSLSGYNGWPRNPKNPSEMDRFVTAYANQRISHRKALESVGEFLIAISPSLANRRDQIETLTIGRLLTTQYQPGYAEFNNGKARDHSAHAAKFLDLVSQSSGVKQEDREAAVLSASYLGALSKVGESMSEVAGRLIPRTAPRSPARQTEAAR